MTNKTTAMIICDYLKGLIKDYGVSMSMIDNKGRGIIIETIRHSFVEVMKVYSNGYAETNIGRFDVFMDLSVKSLGILGNRIEDIFSRKV